MTEVTFTSEEVGVPYNPSSGSGGGGNSSGSGSSRSEVAEATEHLWNPVLWNCRCSSPQTILKQTLMETAFLSAGTQMQAVRMRFICPVCQIQCMIRILTFLLGLVLV